MKDKQDKQIVVKTKDDKCLMPCQYKHSTLPVPFTINSIKSVNCDSVFVDINCKLTEEELMELSFRMRGGLCDIFIF